MTSGGIEGDEDSASTLGFDALTSSFETLKRKRLIVVMSCASSGVFFAGVFLVLGITGMLKPAFLAYGIGALTLVMDLVGAAVLFVVQGRAIDRLKGEIVSRFPGMPIEP